MAAIVLDIDLFRAQCAEYADVTKYPDALITMDWDQAVMMSDDADYGMITGGNKQFTLNLLTAHLMALSNNVATGNQGGFVTSSTIGDVSVAKKAPPTASMLDWWLSQTPRGQQLLAMLQISSVGGISIGGLPESSAFRKWNGVF